MNRILLFVFAVFSFFCAATLGIAQDDGFKQIFDGKSLDGWSGEKELWKVEDGVLVGETTAQKPLQKNSFLVWRGGDVADFELRFQFRISGERSNSGVQFRCAQEGDKLIGYQADIDLAGKWLGSIYDEDTSRKSLCDRGQKITINDQGERTAETTGDKKAIFEQLDMSGFNEYLSLIHI